MGQNSGISWTDATWNPWQGCHKVSEGCRHCYMYRDKKRYGQDPAAVVRSRPATFNAPLTKFKGPLVFTCSWSDFFIENADPWRDEAWNIIRQTPHLTYQILTKRPENIAGRLPADWGNGWPNVWLGVTVEDQSAADERIPQLLRIPAAMRFLSCEPLLGPVNLMQVAYPSVNGHAVDVLRGGFWQDGFGFVNHSDFPGVIDWVIAGGESGPEARLILTNWVRSLRDQTIAAGVPFFFKQWGNWDVAHWGHWGAWVEQRSGCLLDGREWKQFPGGLTAR